MRTGSGRQEAVGGEHLVAGAGSLHTHNASAGGLQGRGHLVWESLEDRMPAQHQGWGGYMERMLE